MSRDMNTSISLAMSFASGPAPPTRKPSQCGPRRGGAKMRKSRMKSTDEKDNPSRRISIYKGISDRPLGWKPRRHQVKPTAWSAARDTDIRKFDGAEQTSIQWDALRRDPELWFANGDCLVYLYGHGQSKRGPAFQIPYTALLNAQCYPLLESCEEFGTDPSCSESYDGSKRGHLDRPISSRRYQLYIPAPPGIGRQQAMLFHIATRNFFAWVFGLSLVGPQLTDALIGLLNKMNDFRLPGLDNVSAMMDYMEGAGYADMRDQPNHALAILGLAEHFHFRDLYIDAHVHCVGMGQKVYESSEFQFTSQLSRSLITRGRVELNSRLSCHGRSLSSFLEEELRTAYEGLPLNAQEHMDRFRCFLHEHYVSKLGYYPPKTPSRTSSAFPKDVYATMYYDFKTLYEFLVDNSFTRSDWLSESANDTLHILESLESFDERYNYDSLVHPFPLLPSSVPEAPDQSFARRLGTLGKGDKMRRNTRLAILATLLRATNRSEIDVSDSPIVKAYERFEKQCVIDFKAEKCGQLSAADGRKVRWLVIYAMLQMLHSIMAIPAEVHDSVDVPYHLCASIVGCPPWEEEEIYKPQSQIQSVRSVIRSTPTTSAACRTRQDVHEDIIPISSISDNNCSDSYSHMGFDKESLQSCSPTVSQSAKGRSTVQRALSTLGNMPELVQPRPKTMPFHEILIEGYGNGLNALDRLAISSVDSDLTSHRRQTSVDSNVSEKSSSQWPQTSSASSTPPSSINETSISIQSLEPKTRTSSVYSHEEAVKVLQHLAPAPLSIPVRSSSLRAIRNGREGVQI